MQDATIPLCRATTLLFRVKLREHRLSSIRLQLAPCPSMAESWFPNGPILASSPSVIVWTLDTYRALVSLTLPITLVGDVVAVEGPRSRRSKADTSLPQDTGCCPSLGQCCPGSPYCKAQSNGVCCGSTGVCPGGFECNSICRCVETGGSCCADGRYCQAGHSCCYSGCVPDGGQCCSNGQMCDVGNICVVNLSNGRYGCCTDLSCTAYVESGSTIALTHSTPVVTTEAPRVTQTVDSGYVYYYWTFTWYGVPFSPNSALLY